MTAVKDNSKITAKGRLASGGSQSGEGKFKFWIDDAPAPDHTEDVDLGHEPSPSGEAVSYEYTLKPVPEVVG